MQEHIFGASNTNAVSGHGGLTVGVSNDGDLSVLSWPGPTFADQLAYVSSNDLDVRDEPHLGALDGMGSYLGLLVTTTAGTKLVWLRDATTFTHAQKYVGDDSVVPETTFVSSTLGLTVTLHDVVSVDVDVLTRHVVVQRDAASPVSAASLVLYENLSPTVSRIPMVPFADWALDAHNDFVAVWDASTSSVVHVHPSDRSKILAIGDAFDDPAAVDYGPVDALMRSSAPSDADVAAFVTNVDAAFPPAVAAVVTTEPPPTAFQVGSDATPICTSIGKLVDNLKALPAAFPGLTLPIDTSVGDALRCTDALPAIRTARKWTWAPEDALADLSDGSLSSSRIAAGQTNAAMIAPLSFAGDRAEASALFAFGGTVADAHGALAKATTSDAAAREAASLAATSAFLSSAALPDPSLGDRVVAVARRALLNVYVARDRSSGAIVAGVSHQPPYYVDWPRDGAFLQHALDVAGLGARGVPDGTAPWVTQRSEWYTTIQRREADPPNPIFTPLTPTDPDTGSQEFPAFAWEMNYYADGTIAGNIRFEIDNTALHVWSSAAHAAYLSGSDRDAYMRAVWPTMNDALHLLVRWKDPQTGLPWPANEDDHYELSSTLHGATAVYAALVAGARFAHALGEEDDAQAFLARANELRAATLSTYYDDKTGLFRDTPQTGTEYIPGTTGTGVTAWLAWPARLLDQDDPRLEAQLVADMNAVLKDIRGETEGGAYVMKNVVSAALLGKDGGARDLARDAVKRLADIATPDTMHFGEVFVTTHPTVGGPPVFSARVAPPHVWEGVLFYLSAMALTMPKSFDEEIGVMPLPPPATSSSSSGCGCRTSGEGEAAGAGAIAALVLSARASRRRDRRRRDR